METLEIEKIRELRQRLDGPNHHQRDEQLTRNGRWGTCVDCPKDVLGVQHPEDCKYTDRYDHNLADPIIEFVDGIISDVRRGIHLNGEFK